MCNLEGSHAPCSGAECAICKQNQLIGNLQVSNAPIINTGNISCPTCGTCPTCGNRRSYYQGFYPPVYSGGGTYI